MEPELFDYGQFRRDAYKRTVLLAIVSGGLGFLCFWLGPPYQYLYIGLAISWMIDGLRVLRPGKCVICQKRTNIIAPLDIRDRPAPRRWWDPRNPSRRDRTWVCPDHITDFVVMQVTLRVREAQAREKD
jgi:hypothetical protein